MSISKEYEEIRKNIGSEMASQIDVYLKYHPEKSLSDIYYDKDNWRIFEKWYDQTPEIMKANEPLYLVVENYKGICEHNFLGTKKEIGAQLGITEKELDNLFLKEVIKDEALNTISDSNPTYYARSNVSYNIRVCDDLKKLIDYLAGNSNDLSRWTKDTDWYCDFEKERCGKEGMCILEKYARKFDLQIPFDNDSKASDIQASSDKRVIMEATFQVTTMDGISAEEYLDKELAYMDVGGFCFEKDGLEIPFDFEATARSFNDDGSIVFGNFDGFPYRIYDVDPCYADDYEALGLSMEDITAELLASADRIEEFYFQFCDNHNDEPIPCTLELKEIVFQDEEEKTYSVNENILKDYNKYHCLEDFLYFCDQKELLANTALNKGKILSDKGEFSSFLKQVNEDITKKNLSEHDYKQIQFYEDSLACFTGFDKEKNSVLLKKGASDLDSKIVKAVSKIQKDDLPEKGIKRDGRDPGFG